jgi:hypothetical protein
MRTLSLLLGLLLSSTASAQADPDVSVGAVYQDDVEIGVVIYLTTERDTEQTWYLYPGWEAPTLRNRLGLTVRLADPPDPDADPPQPDLVLAEAQARFPGGTLITSIATTSR